MFSPFSCRLFPILLFAAVAAGCGGDASIGTWVLPPTAPPAAAAPSKPPVPSEPPALVVSSDALALKVSGQSRQFIVTNVGGQDAVHLTATLTTALPTGTHLTTDCAALAPGASCMLTITPGATPTAAPGELEPVPAGVSIAGTNTNLLALSVWVLDVGGVYQGGLVFDIDDETPMTGGVGGKVLALGNVGERRFFGSPDYVSISPAATSTSDGAANTAAIVAQFGPPPNAYLEYPAWACHSSEEEGFTDWYLPAICELGYDANNVGTGCGTSQTPALPNVRSNLSDRGYLNAGLVNVWSSTQLAPSATWQQLLGNWPAQHQTRNALYVTEYVRCARALTP